jgi:predicted kinase
MKKLIMLMGLPASGKSRWSKDFISLNSNAVIVSSDAIRLELYGSEEDQSHNVEVFEELHRRIHNYLSQEDIQTVIYDATNLSSKRRKGFISQIPKGVWKEIVVFATDYDIILRQNAARSRHVPKEVIERMYRQMQMPRMWEGWDSIVIHPHEQNSSTLSNVLQACVNFDQENIHHSSDLYTHMYKAAEYVKDNAYIYKCSPREMAIVYIAALFHDIGKPATKTYVKANGECDGQAHYYGHAEVSAYMVACLLRYVPIEDFNDWRMIIRLIQYHMDCYSYRGDASKFYEKIKLYEGERFKELLELLHEGDVCGH